VPPLWRCPGICLTVTAGAQVEAWFRTPSGLPPRPQSAVRSGTFVCREVCVRPGAACLDGAWKSTLNTCLRLSSVTCMRHPRQSGPSGNEGHRLFDDSDGVAMGSGAARELRARIADNQPCHRRPPLRRRASERAPGNHKRRFRVNCRTCPNRPLRVQRVLPHPRALACTVNVGSPLDVDRRPSRPGGRTAPSRRWPVSSDKAYQDLAAEGTVP
jgi:hypothetical protein